MIGHKYKKALPPNIYNHIWRNQDKLIHRWTEKRDKNWVKESSSLSLGLLVPLNVGHKDRLQAQIGSIIKIQIPETEIERNKKHQPIPISLLSRPFHSWSSGRKSREIWSKIQNSSKIKFNVCLRAINGKFYQRAHSAFQTSIFNWESYCTLIGGIRIQIVSFGYFVFVFLAVSHVYLFILHLYFM